MAHFSTSPTTTILTGLTMAFALAACGGSDKAPPVPTNPMLEMSGFNLEDLGPNAVYEGWLVSSSGPVSTGRFSVDSKGVLSKSTFMVSQADYDKATAFILTIEPAQNDVPAASDQHLIAGNFNSAKTAVLSTSHASALGTDFNAAMGSFILATPSSESPATANQGIWFLKMVDGAATASLTLPKLPKGWAYEGWAVVNGIPYSTGRFTDPGTADSDGKGPRGGPLGTPAYPGQDFITPPLVLTGGAAVISVEPEPDNSGAPFILKPLMNPSIPASVGPANNHPMGNRGTAVLPKGTVMLTKS